MKTITYRLVLKHIILITACLKLVEQIISLLNVAFNYSALTSKKMPLYPQKWLSKFEIKKGVWVFVPSGYSAKIGAEIKEQIELFWSPPSYFFHLNDGGHIKALKSHINHTQFIHLDIKEFYNSINKSRVTRCLKSYIGYKKAREIAIESTVRHPIDPHKKFILPFGFIQSPILASICLSKSSLGIYLNKLSHRPSIATSIYMDDIIISSESKKSLTKILGEIKLAAEKSRLFLNPAKEEGPANTVTAFNIHLSYKHLVIKKHRMNQFADVFRASANPHQRKGIYTYIKSVNVGQLHAII